MTCCPGGWLARDVSVAARAIIFFRAGRRDLIGAWSFPRLRFVRRSRPGSLCILLGACPKLAGEPWRGRLCAAGVTGAGTGCLILAAGMASADVELFPADPAGRDTQLLETLGKRGHHGGGAAHVDRDVGLAGHAVRRLLGGEVSVAA